MKQILPFVLAIFLGACRMQLISSNKLIIIPATNNYLEGVKGPRFQGSIFKNNYPKEYFYHAFDSVTRFTPTRQDIAEAETILMNQLKDANRLRPNQVQGNPIIHKNLPKYFRQYVGFTNENGDKIVHINFHWNRYNIIDKINNYIYFNDNKINYESNYSIVMDGGSYYWEIDANITQKKLTNLRVNGFG